MIMPSARAVVGKIKAATRRTNEIRMNLAFITISPTRSIPMAPTGMEITV